MTAGQRCETMLLALPICSVVPVQAATVTVSRVGQKASSRLSSTPSTTSSPPLRSSVGCQDCTLYSLATGSLVPGLGSAPNLTLESVVSLPAIVNSGGLSAGNGAGNDTRSV